MPQIKSEPIRIEIAKPKTYSKEELKKFDDLVQKYYEDYLLHDGEKRRFLNYEKLSVAFGATTDKGAVILKGFGSETTYKNGEAHTRYWYDRPVRQDVLDSLLKQWSWWKNGQDWVENKRLEHLNETAKQIADEKTKIADDMEEVFNNF